MRTEFDAAYIWRGKKNFFAFHLEQEQTQTCLCSAAVASSSQTACVLLVSSRLLHFSPSYLKRCLFQK